MPLISQVFEPRRKTSYALCTAATDRSGWNPKLARFYEYWLAIAPPGKLPGRQHFDPLDIPELLPRIWMLDVLHEPRRFRYRLAGTKEVETLQREVTGRWFDEVHPHLMGEPEATGRFEAMIESRLATYRKGRIVALHHKDHQIVENVMCPFARDGVRVDLIAACSILYYSRGVEN
jgi:hypothetical protein